VQIIDDKGRAALSPDWARVMVYYNSPKFTQQMIACEAFHRLVVMPIHDAFGGVMSGAVNKVKGVEALQPLPPGFNAPTMGEALRFSRALLHMAQHEPRLLLATSLAEMAEVDAGADDQIEQAVQNCRDAAAVIEDRSFNKWLYVYEQLPLITFEIGGPKSKLFLRCFINGA
jgi:hypothetical protein